jgi:hypothetical protein
VGERGALKVHAVEVVWECVVGWAEGEQVVDLDLERDMGGVETGSKDAFPLAQGGQGCGHGSQGRGDEGEAGYEKGDDGDSAGNIITATPQERELDDIEEGAEWTRRWMLRFRRTWGPERCMSIASFIWSRSPPFCSPSLTAGAHVAR